MRSAFVLPLFLLVFLPSFSLKAQQVNPIDYREKVKKALQEGAGGTTTLALIEQWRAQLFEQGSTFNLAETYLYEGEYHLNKEAYSEALRAFREAEALWKKAPPADDTPIGILYLNLGRVYFLRYDYVKAADSYLKALRIFEKNKQDAYACETLSQLGETYITMKNLTKGIQYLERGVEVCSRLEDISNLASMENSLAVAYSDNGQHENAIEHYKKAYDLCVKMEYHRGMYYTLSNIGYEYYLLKKYQEALKYFQKAFEVVEKNQLHGIEAGALVNMSYVYFDRGDYAKALELQKQSLALAKETGRKFIEQECYEAMSRTYEKMGQTVLALDFYKKAVALKDELQLAEQQEAANQIMARYELEKAEMEKERAQQELSIKELRMQRQRYAVLLFAAVAILALVMAFFIWRQAEQRRKVNQELTKLNALLKEQKEEIELQNEQLAATNNKILESIRYAQRIQAALFPSMAQFKSLFPESAIFWRPKDIVSGDFYWCAQKDGFIYLAVSDCTGHGVPGGFMTVMGINFLNQILYEDNVTDPAEILTKLDYRITTTLQKHDPEVKDGMDIALLRINPAENILVVSLAKQRMHILSDEGYEELQPSKYSIGAGGLYNEKVFENQVISLHSGQVFYLHTDGYIDQFDASNRKKFKIKQFKEILREIYTLPFEEQERILAERFDAWKGNQTQTDDVLVLAFRCS
ncbi:serine phosphatase RsbU (regulator of sigma subunit) [Thermonema lapsum]|uniref:Serine phosphatase RsbU (Regulator of sigma subunit) n=1 Tax=Thermonema lapsum TaxID=28195 RepID=A0A846MS76_9BACT|nr:tetratricopeptide repeat protein [Thermonema lapsum]NIK74315.1 serine phosphatase RsbU (regulator of sigma subunit) [Thermonema lapsum]